MCFSDLPSDIFCVCEEANCIRGHVICNVIGYNLKNTSDGNTCTKFAN